jgi:hypothetical protein
MHVCIVSTALAAWSSGVISACRRGDRSYGSWDRIPPGYRKNGGGFQRKELFPLVKIEGSFLNEFSRLQKSWRLRQKLAPTAKVGAYGKSWRLRQKLAPSHCLIWLCSRLRTQLARRREFAPWEVLKNCPLEVMYLVVVISNHTAYLHRVVLF